MRRRTLVVLAVAVVWAFAVGAWAVRADWVPLHRPRHATRGAELGEAGATVPGGPRVGKGTGTLDGAKARWILAENSQPGTQDWKLTGDGRGIEGFADQVSVNVGDFVTLYVSTPAPTYRVEAYRMGYYGGAGGRLVWRSAPIAGYQQAAAVREYRTNMITAPWSPSMRFQVAKQWPPGVYLFKLVTDANAQSYVPLTVRDDNSTAAYVVQNAVTTWQAYNLWGGYDLYEGRSGSTGSSYANRSRIASFDRPYTLGQGSGDFLGNELPLISLMEQQGLDVTYWTDVDLHRRPDLLLRHKALLTLGHDEYWTTSMRRGAEAARDHGVNLAFFGANAVFRHIRLEPSEIGADRLVVGFKSAREDPLSGTQNDEVTVNWREPPLNEPESTLIGDYYECNPVKADMVVADPTAWVFDGTGLALGDRLPEVVGPEYDGYDPSAPGPENVQLLAHSPLRCRGKLSHSDMTYYTAPSGAGVFATGTNWWISRLADPCPFPDCPHDAVVKITENVLRAFGAGPAGLAHPSVANAADVPNLPGSYETTTTLGRRRARSSPATQPYTYGVPNDSGDGD